MRWIFGLTLAVLAAPLAAEQNIAVSAEDQAAVARAQRRGVMLYVYDQAAWHGTDDMKLKVKDWQQRLGGYIAEGTPAATTLTFYDRAGSKAVYVARFARGAFVEGKLVEGADAQLSPMALRMIAAREAAAEVIQNDTAARPCTAASFNTVVLPPETPEGAIAVYFLTARTDWSSIPMGGHYEVDVDGNGKVGPVRPFTKSCIAIPLPKDGDKGRTMQAVTVSQLIGDTPTEIHVFSSITLRKPVYVITGDKDDAHLWVVSGPRISEPVSPKR